MIGGVYCLTGTLSGQAGACVYLCMYVCTYVEWASPVDSMQEIRMYVCVYCYWSGFYVQAQLHVDSMVQPQSTDRETACVTMVEVVYVAESAHSCV